MYDKIHYKLKKRKKKRKKKTSKKKKITDVYFQKPIRVCD